MKSEFNSKFSREETAWKTEGEAKSIQEDSRKIILIETGCKASTSLGQNSIGDQKMIEVFISFLINQTIMKSES